MESHSFDWKMHSRSKNKDAQNCCIARWDKQNSIKSNIESDRDNILRFETILTKSKRINVLKQGQMT